MTNPTKEAQSDRICIKCSSFFPDKVDSETEFGFCLADEAFQPFIDEIFSNNLDCCKQLIHEKRFPGDNEACSDFKEAKSFEIDDELGEEIISLAKNGDLNDKSLFTTIWRHGIKNSIIDSPSMQKQLASLSPEEQKSDVETLASMGSLGNEAAFDALYNHFVAMEYPTSIGDVHHKAFVFDRLTIACGDDKQQLLEPLIRELIDIPSNNTTRQWIDTILKFLAKFPDKNTRAAFEKILSGKKRSQKFKQKIRSILDAWDGNDNWDD